MTAWTRALRISSSQRHWIATLRTALYHWSRPYCKRLCSHFIPKLERLESIEAPVSVFVPAALLGAAAIVRAAEPAHETPALERSASLADIFQTARSDWDRVLADVVFIQTATRAESLSEFHHVLAGMEHLLSEDDAALQHQVNERILDPMTTALNALLDPLANPAPANETTNAGHGPAAPTGNGPPPNQAGVYGGGGQGAAGPSTPFAGGGGGSPVGEGGGNGTANQLNTLGIQGFFSPAFASNMTAAAPTPARAQPQAQATPMLSPPPPTVQFFQGSDLTTQELAGQATIFVQLSAAASQPVSVQYATSDGTALAGTDYTTTTGTLTFPTGTTQESFNVPILDDNLSGETSPETVNLTLSNPSGATLGSPSAVTLDILEDSDSGSGPPVANNDSYSLPHDTTLSEPAPGVLANDTDLNGINFVPPPPPRGAPRVVRHGVS